MSEDEVDERIFASRSFKELFYLTLSMNSIVTERFYQVLIQGMHAGAPIMALCFVGGTIHC
jgi:hypothetical protein